MNILEKIVDRKKLPVLFIGSGLPKRYLKNFPSWEELLKMSFKLVNPDPYYYRKYADQLDREKLTEFEKYKKLGTILEREFNEAFYERKFRIGRGQNPAWAKRGISPLKMHIRETFKSMPIIRNPILSEELKELKLLRNKVSAAITTNYDNFIETFILGSDYTVFNRQHELFSKNVYNISELYKIHGSINDVETIIITEEDYDKFDESQKLFIAKMLTLFTESPIIFLGYSFTDENIRKIVSDFISCLNNEQIKTIHEHFVFITYKEREMELEEISRIIVTADGKEIPITEIRTDNFLGVYKTLNRLLPGMTPKIIRDTQRLVKKIVTESVISGDSSNVIIGIDEMPEDLHNSNIAIAIGYKENITNQFGYALVPDSNIFEDIIFDNHRDLDPTQMCLTRFKSITYRRLLPVFKYVKRYNSDINDIPKLSNYIEGRNTVEKLIPKNVIKAYKTAPIITTPKAIDEEFSRLNDVDKLFRIVLKNIGFFTIPELRQICANYFYDYKDDLMKSTYFKRVVMYIDLKENLI